MHFKEKSIHQEQNTTTPVYDKSMKSLFPTKHIQVGDSPPFTRLDVGPASAQKGSGGLLRLTNS
jgi:hypothetical protein